MATDDVLTAVVIVGVLGFAAGIGAALHTLERRLQKREATQGIDPLERYLAEHHANR